MGRKIFVSYKYSDSKVLRIAGLGTTARDYVDKIDELLEEGDHIFKGEADGEDMSTLNDATIGSKLGDKIFDSTVTIVLISKGMKEPFLHEKEQWMPWEISYSLKEQSREGCTSKTNAVLGVVLPDEAGRYDYYITNNHLCNSRTLNTDFLFRILSDNMFNRINKEDNIRYCNGSKVYEGNPSYVYSIEWEKFASNHNRFIDIAIEIRKNINEYNLSKNMK